MSTSPFTILIDTKEKNPWTFEHVPGGCGEGTIVVPREWQALGDGYGDYTIKGTESQTCRWRLVVERKSLSDLFGTILSRRRRFEIELENLNQMEYAAVIVEANLSTVLNYRPKYWEEMKFSMDRQMKKHRQVIGSIQAWQLRYPIIRWWFLPRKYAETWAYRLFARWWKDNKAPRSRVRPIMIKRKYTQ
jgi:ERCC4-type nuclease